MADDEGDALNEEDTETDWDWERLTEPTLVADIAMVEEREDDDREESAN